MGFNSVFKGLNRIGLWSLLSTPLRVVLFAVILKFNALKPVAVKKVFKTIQWTNKGNKVKVKWSHCRPGVAQRVGRGIALLFHDRGTRTGWVVSSTPQPHFTPGKDPVPIVQEAGWVPGPVWTGGKSRPHRDSIPDHPARGQSLYRLSYPAHEQTKVGVENHEATY